MFDIMTNALRKDSLPIARRYVAVCDVLGFENMIKTLKLKEMAIKYYTLIINTKLVINNYSNFFPESGDVYNLVSHSIFSDTLLIWSRPLNAEDYAGDLETVSTFFDVCNVLIAVGISLDMPLRIGIAYGAVCIDPNESFFVGKPIVSAYKLEQSQKWIGGACHTSCIRAPHFDRVAYPWKDVIKYRVPVTAGYEDLFVLNWVRGLSNTYLNYFNDKAKKASTGEIAKKYTATASFFKKSQQKNNTTVEEALHEFETHGYKIINKPTVSK